MKPPKPSFLGSRHAPRMRKGSFSIRVLTRETFKKFRKEYPEYKKMPWRDFYDNWCEIAERVRYYSVQNPLGVKLGSYLGEIKFQYLPQQKQALDRETSIQLGELTNYLDIPTRGKLGTVKWERRWAVKFNKILQFYAFDGARGINELAFKRATEFPELIRVSRNTLGGQSVWRQKMKQYDQKGSN